jgi:hypothetical protein
MSYVMSTTSALARSSARGKIDRTRRWRAPARKTVVATGLAVLPCQTPLCLADRKPWSCIVQKQNGMAGGCTSALIGSGPDASQALASASCQFQVGALAKWIEPKTTLLGESPWAESAARAWAAIENELLTRIVTGRTWRNLEEHLDHASTFDSPDARDCFCFGF